MEGKPENRLQEVSADDIGRLIQAVAHYCSISPKKYFTRRNTTSGASPQKILVERNMPS